nr:hypothetical protein Q903MT_gene2377 [Picea sitchensis]
MALSSYGLARGGVLTLAEVSTIRAYPLRKIFLLVVGWRNYVYNIYCNYVYNGDIKNNRDAYLGYLFGEGRWSSNKFLSLRYLVLFSLA